MFSLSTKLAQKSNTVQALEEKLQEKESVVNRLEQDKNKLENYSKQVYCFICIPNLNFHIKLFLIDVGALNFQGQIH